MLEILDWICSEPPITVSLRSALNYLKFADTKERETGEKENREESDS